MTAGGEAGGRVGDGSGAEEEEDGGDGSQAERYPPSEVVVKVSGHVIDQVGGQNADA